MHLLKGEVGVVVDTCSADFVAHILVWCSSGHASSQSLVFQISNLAWNGCELFLLAIAASTPGITGPWVSTVH